MTMPKKIAKPNNAMTLKARAFIDSYIKNGGNGVRAYLDAYASDDNDISYETAGANACRLLKDARVRVAIDERMHEMITPEWIENEIQKDIVAGDKQQRTAGLALLARVRSMVSEKRVNVIEQRKEFGEIALDSYAETARPMKKEIPTA